MEKVEKTAKKERKYPKNTELLVFGVIALLVVSGLSFLGGVTYEKDQNKGITTASFGTTRGGMMGFGEGGVQRGSGMRSLSEVTAVSETSVTVENTRTNQTAEYKISSSTKVINNGVSGTASDIKVGQYIVVTPESSDATTASVITIGSGMMGGPRFNAQFESGNQTN